MVNTVVFSSYTFDLIPKVFNTIDVIFTSYKQSRMIDAFMVKVTHIQSVVTSITISINHTVGSDFAITIVGTPLHPEKCHSQIHHLAFGGYVVF
ncbi:MAG: hypothetical protein H6R05_1303 [Burkholderiaceae bacterium]|nr:hypothetical protein [Burkholderiaceae bacterium]